MARKNGPEDRGRPEPAIEESASADQGRRRLRGFRYHLAGYVLVMTILVPANLMTTPENPWFVWPMVGWGGVLAVHTAWVMELF